MGTSELLGGGSDPPSTKSVMPGGGSDPPSTKSVMLGGSDPPSTKSVMLGGGGGWGVVDTNQRLQLQVKASSCSLTNAKHTKPTKIFSAPPGAEAYPLHQPHFLLCLCG